MNYRLSTIYPRKSHAADVTEIIEINVADPISAFIIEMSVGNTASAAPTAHALECLTNISLVDGSDVLFSLSGKQADALDWYCNGLQRSNWNPYLNGMDTQRFIGINFGRHLWDGQLAFDPKKFRNPQLKFSIDLDAGGCAPDEVVIEIWACVFDQKEVTPIGFLMAKEIKDYLLAASAHEYSDMPTDHMYRKMLIRCQRAGTEPNQILDNIKLSEDQDKRVVFDHGTEDIFRSIAIRTPKYHEEIIGHVGTTQTYGYCTPTSRVNGICQRWAETVGAGEIAFYDGDGGRFKVISATIASNMQVTLAGWLPHGVWEIPFGDQNDMADWYDVTKIGSLRADILTGSGALTTDSVQLFLQQLRKYAGGA